MQLSRKFSTHVCRQKAIHQKWFLGSILLNCLSLKCAIAYDACFQKVITSEAINASWSKANHEEDLLACLTLTRQQNMVHVFTC